MAWKAMGQSIWNGIATYSGAVSPFMFGLCHPPFLFLIGW
jgi:hypothetical protein